MATQPQSYFVALRGQQYMNLITYRKNGQALSTPVWFAQDSDRLYVMTGAAAGKVKRIRNNPRVEVGPSDRAGKSLGPTIAAQARVLVDGEIARADALLNQKYGLLKRVFDLASKLSRSGGRAFLEITPGNQ